MAWIDFTLFDVAVKPWTVVRKILALGKTRSRVLTPKQMIGLIAIHLSTSDALKNVRFSIARTRTVKILANRGGDWIGEDSAVLSETISERSRSVAGLLCQILLLNKNAPYLKEWSQKRHRAYKYVKENFTAAHKLIENYYATKITNPKLGSGIRYHSDTPVWRLLITDDRAFVSSYAHEQQAREGFVLEFEGNSNDKAFYWGYNRYFDFLWDHSSLMEESVWENFRGDMGYDICELSSGAVVYGTVDRDTRVILLRRHDDFMTLPKGHIEDNERPEDAVLREILEETSLPAGHVDIKKALGWYPNPLCFANGKRTFKVIKYFLIHLKTDSSFPPLKPDKEHASAAWYPISDVYKFKYAYTHTEQVLRQAFDAILLNQ